MDEARGDRARLRLLRVAEELAHSADEGRVRRLELLELCNAYKSALLHTHSKVIVLTLDTGRKISHHAQVPPQAHLRLTDPRRDLEVT